MTTQNGWIIATDRTAITIWSFPPKNNAAYPAAVKRQIEKHGGGADVNMSIKCEASKAACDDLVAGG